MLETLHEAKTPEITRELDLLTDLAFRNKAILEELRERLIPITTSRQNPETEISKPACDRETAVGQSIYESRVMIEESIEITFSILDGLQL